MEEDAHDVGILLSSHSGKYGVIEAARPVLEAEDLRQDPYGEVRWWITSAVPALGRE